MSSECEHSGDEPYIPDLGDAAGAPGLPEVSRMRLKELLTNVLFASGPDGRSTRRIECEHRAGLALAVARRLESSYERQREEARSYYKYQLTGQQQLVQRCAFVGAALALYQLYAARRHHTRALAAELSRAKKLIRKLPEDHPLVALVANLAVLVSKHGQISPWHAFQLVDGKLHLPSKKVFEAVKTVFEETVAGAQGGSHFLETRYITVPFIEIFDAKGVELALGEAVRNAKLAQEHCQKLGVVRDETWHPMDERNFEYELAHAQRNKDRRAIRRILQEQQDHKAGVSARLVELRVRHACLQAARERLSVALSSACRAISFEDDLSVADNAAVASLTSVINCIAAQRLLFAVKVDEELNAKTLDAGNNEAVSLKDYIDVVIAQLL